MLKHYYSLLDADVLDALKPYEESIDGKIKAIIGYTDVLLDNNNMKCKLGECNIGNLITDAYVDYVSTLACMGTEYKHVEESAQR